MLDQGNPCGGFGWQNWSKSGVGVRLPKRNPSLSPTLFSTRGWGMPWGRNRKSARGGSGPGSIRVNTSGVARAPDSLWAARGRPRLDTLPKCHRISSV